MTELDLQWRAMRDTDRNYVLSSWLRSYADGPEFKDLARHVYFALYEPHVHAMLDRSTVAIAWTEELPDTVLGFTVIEPPDVVHFVHVKRRWRQLGVARWMTRDMRALPATFTHRPTFASYRLIGETWKYDSMRRFERKAA